MQVVPRMFNNRLLILIHSSRVSLKSVLHHFKLLSLVFFVSLLSHQCWQRLHLLHHCLCGGADEISSRRSHGMGGGQLECACGLVLAGYSLLSSSSSVLRSLYVSTQLSGLLCRSDGWREKQGHVWQQLCSSFLTLSVDVHNVVCCADTMLTKSCLLSVFYGDTLLENSCLLSVDCLG